MSNKNKKNIVICVLGMHRSGTSMLMRLLNICGVYISEEQNMVIAANSNEKGHWEHKKVLEINEEILNIFNGRWDKPPVLEDGWESDSRLDKLYVEAKEFVDEMNQHGKVWGFKEPRTCLTLAFWQKIIPDMLYVISFRNPNNVAKSLHRRNMMMYSDGIILWALYWKSILKYTKNEKRHFTFFDRFFLDWQKELNKIIKFINEKNITINNHGNEIRDFISPDLIHSDMLVDDIKNNINLDNITNEVILECVLIAYLKTNNTSIKSRVINQKDEKILDQHKIIQQKKRIISQQNVQLKQKSQQMQHINKKYAIIKKSKSFQIGDLFFRSIKKPYKLVTFPINLIKILMM